MTIKLELFTSNICPKCKKARHMLSALVNELGNSNFDLEFIDVVENIDRSVTSGILATPSLVINHHLVSSPLPSTNELKTILEKSFTENDHQSPERDN